MHVAVKNSTIKDSHLKWSVEERQQLNKLYHDLPTPKNKKNIELWKLYFINFANRFVVFYPNRSVEEVTEKVQECIAKRQFKETGEIMYWQNTTPAVRSIQRIKL